MDSTFEVESIYISLPGMSVPSRRSVFVGASIGMICIPFFDDDLFVIHTLKTDLLFRFVLIT